MALLDSLVVFIVSLLIGGLGIHVGASILARGDDYSHAVVTAAFGALVWAIAGTLFGGIPLLGPLITLLAYLTVIRWRYGVGWLTAGGIALIGWVAAVVVLSVLGILGVADLSATGIPRVRG
ncbi:hypothetical protein [Natronomonas sp. EA1]|uniref:hypothetical protein n=1 Tax=Natronomonas sp. EA1 TaxID=3421655 RepID=UPI003EBB5C46